MVRALTSGAMGSLVQILLFHGVVTSATNLCANGPRFTFHSGCFTFFFKEAQYVCLFFLSCQCYFNLYSCINYTA